LCGIEQVRPVDDRCVHAVHHGRYTAHDDEPPQRPRLRGEA
jgi:hypothetical protein